MEHHQALLYPLTTAPLPLLSSTCTRRHPLRLSLSKELIARPKPTSLNISIRRQLLLTRVTTHLEPNQAQELFSQEARPVQLPSPLPTTSFTNRRTLASITAQRTKSLKTGRWWYQANNWAQAMDTRKKLITRNQRALSPLRWVICWENMWLQWDITTSQRAGRTLPTLPSIRMTLLLRNTSLIISQNTMTGQSQASYFRLLKRHQPVRILSRFISISTSISTITISTARPTHPARLRDQKAAKWNSRMRQWSMLISSKCSLKASKK